MTWSPAQRNRLGIEKTTLAKYFKRVTWIDPTGAETGSTKVDVKVTTSNEKCYTLRVYILNDFPNSCPVLVVKQSPYYGSNMLRHKDGRELIDCDAHAFHIYGKHDSYLQICHFLPSSWDSNTTLYQVLMKGLIWLEAYEAHLKTGNGLDTYLKAYGSDSGPVVRPPAQEESCCLL